MRESAEHETENSRVGKALLIGASVRVGRLEDVRRVRAELGRLYREARQREGRYPSALEAQRLANILASITKSIETQELEARIARIEATNART